ncbi:MAG: sulfate adenylyltransferase, partial [Candidatus Aminicenantes bacterium]|nr:sulfate adenylyltransferase [Candidatus Aminicenantes bacterium]
MSKLVPPHGGRLNLLLVEGEERAEQMERAKSMPQVRLSS